jgi:hypothetical protein
MKMQRWIFLAALALGGSVPAQSQLSNVHLIQAEIDQSSLDYLRKLSTAEIRDYERLRDVWAIPLPPENEAREIVSTLTEAESNLHKLGYNASNSGFMDLPTHNALRAYQQRKKILATGELDALTFWALQHDSRQNRALH